MSKLKFSKRLAASLIAAATIGSSGVLTSLSYLPVHAADTDNYAKLLQYSMYFYDGNMCGDAVGETSAFDWRDDCHTGDEIVGGFHDAGDHVKFGLPAGYSASTLGWGYYEFKDSYDSLGQTAHLKKITDYFCDYFKNCTVLSGDTVTNFCYQIGEGGGGADHGYWGPAETQEAIKGKRKAFWTSSGASDIAAAYAAALAMNYINFGNAEDLKYAKALYNFSTQYNANSAALEGPSTFYNSFDYYDDQAWAAGILYLATGEDSYKSFLNEFMSVSGKGSSGQSGCQWGVYSPMCWNNVSLGAAILQAEITKSSSDWSKVTTYLDSKANSETTYYCEDSWGSARHNAAVQMCALVTSKFDKDYTSWSKAQMGMILGDNSTGKNLVVGFNENSPKYPHHRTASGHAYDPTDEGTPKWDAENGHVLVGALVGGPTSSDFSTYNDAIDDAVSNEVALDYNAGLVGAAAGLYAKYKTGSLETNIPGVNASAETTTTTAKTTTTTPTITTTKGTTTTTNNNPTTGGVYEIKPDQDITYSDLPEDDKMIGWAYEDLGVKAGEKVQKVEIDISTTAGEIGKWQGAFGSSTTVDPGYWTQTEDMSQTFSGTKKGTLVWEVDSATSDIIQTQYGGQVKVGFWWIDCDDFTVDAVRVYTDAASVVTTASTTTTTAKTTVTTLKTTTTVTTKAPVVTTTTVFNPDGPTIKVGQQFVNAGEEWATAVKPEIYNGGDFVTEGLSLAFKVGDAADPATAALMEAWTYEDLDSSSAFNDLGSWKVNKDEMIWASLTNGTSKIDVGTLTDGMSPLELYYTIPDEATINKIAADHNMAAKQTEDGAYYYEFPLQFAPDKINSEGGSALLWAGENNTVIDATYVDGSVCVIVTNPNPVTTTTTATSGSTTTTTTTTTVLNPDGPTIKVGQQFVNAGEEWATAVKPEIYNGGDFVTEGLSLAFKVGSAADPATAALMEAWTYEDL
ncbi:MAG: glycoside hydrolase family 9 protein, partial [Oscillospiraceae bacterium]|nr:glycoside hydrolase family 9 protein [Oscillospiraceae bacterium]